MSGEKGYFKSRVFRRLFLSYALIIALFVAGFLGWYFYSYRTGARAMAREACIQRANALCTQVDRRLLLAQGLCNAMNSSESIRELYRQAYIEGRTVDSMLLYRALSELKRIKASSGSLDVYTVLLGINGDGRLYTPGTVVSLNSALTGPERMPWIGVGSVAELLDLQGETNITLNKRFFIYTDSYSGLASGAAKGVCLVLLDPSALKDSLAQARGSIGGIELRRYSELLCADGSMDGTEEVLEIPSLLGGGVGYRVQLAHGALATPFPLSALLPALGTVLLGAVFMAVTYRYSRRRYAPIGAISRMMSGESGVGEAAGDEMDAILRGIAGLIGERNGYREQMITISPYASQGALRQLLDGSVGVPQMEVLREGSFWELRHTYFAVGMVNLAVSGGPGALEQRCLDARTLAEHACQGLADEERAVACCPRDLQTLVVVINSDDRQDVEDAFYRLLKCVEEALDDPATSVTIGVSAPRTELGSLRQACDEAERALENMLTGGRSSVYFEESDPAGDGDYTLPLDAQRRIADALREGNVDDLNRFMDELWEQNFRRASLSPRAARQLVDELHGALNGALRDISQQRTTHIRAERVREPATIEEIFDHYRSLMAEAARTCQSELSSGEEGEDLEKEICDYIDANILSPDLSLSAVADRFGVSGKLVGSVCKSAFGMTYLQYVRECRIRHAARLLETTDLPLEEIAARCGFTNLLTFRRNFKAQMDMNPSDFRK